MNGWLGRMGWVLALVVSACGGGGDSGGSAPPPVNRAPTANFAFSCADLACTLTSTSTDQDAGDAVSAWSWNFGDASAVVATATTPHTFAAAGTYNVALTVTDRAGLTNTLSRPVTVSAAPVPAGPRANFTASCVSLACTFTDTSTFDAGSTFQSRSWDFGDATAPATGSPVVHTYTAATLTTYTVRLTVTAVGGKTSTSVQTIVTAPPASTLNCAGGNCALVLTQASRVTATISGRECGARNTQIVVTAPITQTVFADGCFDAVGVAVPVNGGNLFAANTTLQVNVLSGTFSGSTLVFPPSIRVSGSFAAGWTLTFDDGYGGPGEPDFNDLVIVIRATP